MESPILADEEQRDAELSKEIEEDNKKFRKMLGLDSDIEKSLSGWNITDMCIVQMTRELRKLTKKLDGILTSNKWKPLT